MANEAVLLWETELPIPFTCANGAGIEKGAILKLTDGMTAVINSGDEDDLAGIAAEEKIASNGKIKIPVYRGGIFKVYISGTVNIGDALAMSTDVNFLKAADATCVNSKILGVALEAGTTTETIKMELRPGFNNNAY